MIRAITAIAAAVLVATLSVAAHAAPYRLAPFKDDLFKYPAILQTQDGGNYVLVDYSKQRDLYDRDTIVEKKAKPEYVSLVGAATYDYKGAGDRTLKYMGTGKVNGGAKAVVIYIHGMGGSRVQGVNEWMFGGNFNRIMNLMKQNDGAYLSPDFSDFGPQGAADIRNLVLDQAAKSPNAAIFIACGSWGGAICWQLAADAKAVAAHLGPAAARLQPRQPFHHLAGGHRQGPRFPVYHRPRHRRHDLRLGETRSPSMRRCAPPIRAIRSSWRSSRPASTARRSA